MREISGTHYIISQRTLCYRRMVDGKKFLISPCSTRPDYPDGSRRYLKSGYRQRTSHFPSDRSALASAVFISSFNRARKGCSASWTQAAHSTAKNQCHYRGHSSYDAAQCNTLEHTQYGQSFGCQQGNGMPDMATAQSQAASCRNIQTQPRQAICRKTPRCRWIVSQSAKQSAGLMCRRKKSDSSPRPNPAFTTLAPRYSSAPDARLYTARNNNFIRRLKYARRENHRRLHAPASASRIYPVLTTYKCQNPTRFRFTSYRRQLWYSQASASFEMAQTSSPIPFAFYSDIQLMAQYGGALVQGNYRQTYSPRFIQECSGFNQSNYAVSRQSQPESTRLYLECIGRANYDKDRQM